MSGLITNEIVEAAAREWWQHSKAENDKFFGPLGVEPDPGWDGISEADREHVREDITRPHLEAAAPLIAARVLEEAADGIALADALPGESAVSISNAETAAEVWLRKRAKEGRG